MIHGLELRTDYFGDRRSFRALADLLQDVFDIDIGEVERFGGQEAASMPLGYFDAEGRCVANFSAFPMPLVIDGQPVRAAGYQSGAVRPDYRGQGLYRDLMRRSFARTEAEGFELGLLLTDKPDLYLPYGFAVVEQHFFRGPLPPAVGDRDCRHLSIEAPADVALLQTLLDARAPVSDRFAVMGQGQTFLLNCCFDLDIRLSHMPADNAVVAWKQEDATFQLLDIAAGAIPRFERIVGALGITADIAEVYFPPDKLGWQGVPVPYKGPCELMMTGGRSAPSAGGPFMLSPLADF